MPNTNKAVFCSQPVYYFLLVSESLVNLLEVTGSMVNVSCTSLIEVKVKGHYDRSFLCFILYYMDMKIWLLVHVW